MIILLFDRLIQHGFIEYALNDRLSARKVNQKPEDMSFRSKSRGIRLTLLRTPMSGVEAE